MQDVVAFIRHDPTIGTNTLRPFLEKYIPNFQDMNAQYVTNFRAKVRRWIAIHGPSTSLSYDDAKIIADPTAAEESIGGDSSLCPAYVQDLMSKLMLKGGDIWDVKKLF